MDMTSADTKTIDRLAQRAVLYARWWQAAPVPPPLFGANPPGAMYIRFNFAKKLGPFRGEAECGVQLDMACDYANDEGWGIVGALRDIGQVDNPWDRPGFQEAMGIIRAGHANVLVVSHLDRIARDARTIDAIVHDLGLLGGCLMAASGAFRYSRFR